MTKSKLQIAEIIVGLESKFIPHSDYHEIRDQIEMLYYKRLATIKSGRYSEARGIAVIGASGCGKSTCVTRATEHYEKNLAVPHEAPVVASQWDVVSITVPSPATLKSVGSALLSKMGYELEKEPPDAIIWNLVRYRLKELRVLFLHVDEAQDLLKSGTPKQTQSIVKMLKTILQEPDWPVNLLLSGTQELTKILNHDPQLGRRVEPIAFRRLNKVHDRKRAETFITQYADHAGLRPKSELFEQDFMARLIFAADREFGILIEHIIGAIAQSLRSGRMELSIKSFIDTFAKRTGCVGAANPFVAIEYERLNVRLLLQDKEPFSDV